MKDLKIFLRQVMFQVAFVLELILIFIIAVVAPAGFIGLSIIAFKSGSIFVGIFFALVAIFIFCGSNVALNWEDFKKESTFKKEDEI